MSNAPTVQLEFGLVLPSVTSPEDPCVGRLLATLSGRPGVQRAHLVEGATPARLCVHHDPDRLSVARVEALIRAAGLEVSERYTHLDLPVRGLGNERRARSLADRVLAIDGVLFASASMGRVHVELDIGADRRAVDLALSALGVGAKHPGDEHKHAEGGGHDHAEGGGHDHAEGGGHDHAEGGGHEHGSSVLELGFAVGAGVLTAVGWGLETYATEINHWIPLILLWAAYFFGGFFAVREVIEGLQAKRVQIDFLMLVAAIGAAALGEWAEGALLLVLFSLGHSLEGYAMGRARQAIEALAALAPKTATLLLDDGSEREVGVEELTVGARVLVRPNSQVPSDGFIVKGRSSINQAPITGESMPVDKEPVTDARAAAEDPGSVGSESRVFAGTINGSMALETIVTRLSSDSTLARVVTMVREAQTQQSPTQRFTDRFEKVFVPSVLILVGFCLFAWVVIDEPFSASFYRAMAVLVAASPCALAIATPSAVLSGVARAAKGGVLIKGGAHLESLGSVDVIAFDKTGTLTKGEPTLTDVAVAEGVERAELLRVAGAVERQSDHPLAAAVFEAVVKELGDDLPEAIEVSGITGFGVSASVEGQQAYLGKLGLFTERLGRTLPDDVAAAAERLAEGGRTTILVSHGDRFLGVLGMMDPPRESAAATLRALHDLGIRKLLMLTGDHQRAADGIAKAVGLDDARGDLLPEDKVAAIREAVAAGQRIAMVGDGVNDAPAMAQATIGIAMGAGGSDVALETADVALMADDLSKLPFAVGLSRASRRIIRQNLWASLGMVAFLIPATLTGFAGIGWAVMLHEGSTLIVVANALRLLAYRDSRPS